MSVRPMTDAEEHMMERLLEAKAQRDKLVTTLKSVRFSVWHYVEDEADVSSILDEIDDALTEIEEES